VESSIEANGLFRCYTFSPPEAEKLNGASSLVRCPMALKSGTLDRPSVPVRGNSLRDGAPGRKDDYGD
jgi:hypothetical protein